MKHKIPCFCDNTFTVEVPEEIDLDLRPEYLDEIMNGTFMRFSCSSCGKIHKPEFPLRVLWPSRNIGLEVYPERERMGFYRSKKGGEKTGTVIIGYPEMADRLAVLRDGLEPAAVEALKYYLLLKAEETYPDNEISIWYQSKSEEALEFHLHGLQEGSVAVSRVPLGLYEKTCGDYNKNPRSEPFVSLGFHSYVSVQNMMRPEVLK
jgi:hypothetical protein